MSFFVVKGDLTHSPSPLATFGEQGIDVLLADYDGTNLTMFQILLDTTEDQVKLVADCVNTFYHYIEARVYPSCAFLQPLVNAYHLQINHQFFQDRGVLVNDETLQLYHFGAWEDIADPLFDDNPGMVHMNDWWYWDNYQPDPTYFYYTRDD